MADTIWGVVIDVLDGDTFDLDVSHISETNEYEYNDVERIRLSGVNAPELDEPGGQGAKRRLKSQIAGRFVRVDIKARDRYKRLIGEVFVDEIPED